jgi:hypothetical protein
MYVSKYQKALEGARFYMDEMYLEPRSALKQSANDCGIPMGEEMVKFVAWAEKKLFGGKK